MTTTTVYPIGIIGARLLTQLSHPAQTAALVAHHRLGGLPIPLAPSRLAEIDAWADAWLATECEAGRDVTAAEIRAAASALQAALGGDDAGPPVSTTTELSS